jgi:hypothetical protein
MLTYEMMCVYVCVCVCVYACMHASTGSSDKGEHWPYLEAGDKPITKS